MFHFSYLTITVLSSLLCGLRLERIHSADGTCKIRSTGTYSAMYESLIRKLRDSNCDLTTQYPSDELNNDVETFDYCIVGAGSAGSVVANRLSADRNRTVVLIEAGGKPPVESDIAAYTFYSLVGTSYDWDYRTEKSPFACKAMNNGQCRWPRGKILGGSSSLNALLYTRGNRADYDGWAAAGNEGWSYDEVYPFFKKLENYTAVQTGLYNDHGYDGYLHIEPYRERLIGSTEKMRRLLIGAAEELGLRFVKDINANQTLGVTIVPGTLKDGVRDNTAKAYVSTVANRPNLKVLLNSTVLRVLIEKYSRRAYGVEYSKNGSSTTKNVFCTKEVIVSAGAINSPQLLMLSGVGPSDHLKQFNVPIVKDLPGVGKNLQDHIIFLGCPVVLSDDFNRVPPDDRDYTPEDYLYSYLDRRTDLDSVGALNVIIYTDTNDRSNEDADKDNKIPNIQMNALNFPNMAAYEKYLIFGLNVNESLLRRSLITKQLQVLTIAPTSIVQKSRGQILLRSDDPFERPVIVSGYLTAPEDMRTLLQGIEFTQQLVNTNVMKKFGKLMKVNVGDCGQYTAFSENYWRCLVRYLGSTAYHPVGTCKMGPSSDRLAVVDNEMRVHGIDGLRVVDASVMRTVIRGNTNIPTVMIGERASQFIIGNQRNY